MGNQAGNQGILGENAENRGGNVGNRTEIKKRKKSL